MLAKEHEIKLRKYEEEHTLKLENALKEAHEQETSKHKIAINNMRKSYELEIKSLKEENMQLPIQEEAIANLKSIIQDKDKEMNLSVYLFFHRYYLTNGSAPCQETSLSQSVFSKTSAWTKVSRFDSLGILARYFGVLSCPGLTSWLNCGFCKRHTLNVNFTRCF